MPSQLIPIHFTLKTETLISIFSISKKNLPLWEQSLLTLLLSI